MRVKNSKLNIFQGLSRFEKFVLGVNLLSTASLLLAYLSTYVNPNGVTWLALMGLTYPLYLFTNFICLIYWLAKRRKHFLISVVSIFLGFTHLSHFIQFTILDRNEEDMKTEMKVMSYNVRLFDLYNWTKNEQTRKEIISFLDQEDPDVICLQEFFHTDGEGWQFSTRDTLKQLLSAKNYTEGYSVVLNNGHHFGQCTFSKYPILRSEYIRFDNDASNGFIYTDLLVDEDTVRVYNAHVGSIRFQKEDYDYIGGKGNPKTWPKGHEEAQQKILSRLSVAYPKRADQTKTLLDHVDNSPYKTVVCGDFNDTPVSYNYRQLTRNLYDAFTLSANGIGGTYIGHVPFLRIDYILHDQEMNSFDFTTHQNNLSDHKAISAIVEF
jgi:endonuclease/exonuclease/phosphatase family metal-dependent hydrolase